MERNIHELHKCIPYKTIHTQHSPYTVPFPMAKFYTHAIPNMSCQIPSILTQNEKDVSANPQLSWTGGTNGQSSYDRVQPILIQWSRSTAQPSPTSDPKASHTHCQRLKLPQQDPPLASRITGSKSSSTTPLQRHDHNGPQHLCNSHFDSNLNPTSVNIPWNT
jgi:hypothetical protein